MVGGRGVKTRDNAQTCFTKNINNPAIKLQEFCSVSQWSRLRISVFTPTLVNKVQLLAMFPLNFFHRLCLCCCLSDSVAQMWTELEKNRLCSSSKLSL